MKSQNTRRMVTTAILIALTIVFQLLRPVLGGTNIISTYIIGSLVNLVLILAACVVGLWSGVAVAFVAPLFAVLQNHAQLPMVPWIIAGNVVLVIFFALWAKKDKRLQVEWVRWVIIGAIGTVLKYAVMTLGMTLVQTAATGKAFGVILGVAAGAQFVQIVTAVIAMILGGIILPMLPASIVGQSSK